jgi:hypothetical protein
VNIYQWLCLLGVQGAVATILTIVINRISKKVEKSAEQTKRETGAIKEGVKALLRDRLLQGYKHYINDVGFADEDDRKNMENVYKQYKGLKGNGDMKDLRRTFRRLPFVEGGVPTEVADDDVE